MAEKATSLIVVEDCVSACVGTSLTSVDNLDIMSILGTSIPDETIRYLLDYKKVFIALDDDATGKAIKLQKKLNPYVETCIIPIRKDIKYFNQNEFQKIEKDYLSA